MVFKTYQRRPVLHCLFSTNIPCTCHLIQYSTELFGYKVFPLLMYHVHWPLKGLCLAFKGSLSIICSDTGPRFQRSPPDNRQKPFSRFLYLQYTALQFQKMYTIQICVIQYKFGLCITNYTPTYMYVKVKFPRMKCNMHLYSVDTINFRFVGLGRRRKHSISLQIKATEMVKNESQGTTK